MIQTICKITNAEQLNATTFRFVIHSKAITDEAWCGRFVNILCGEKTLRRPISICEIDKNNNTFTIVFEVRGEGTKWLSERKTGDEIDILGPLGNGFFPDKAKGAVFIGGGIGCPPMLGAAEDYGKDAVAILGFRSKENAILIDDFKAQCKSVYVTTNDGTLGTKGFVTDVLKSLLEKDSSLVVYSCGPMPMQKGIAEMCEKYGAECYVSLEQRMGCGIGACLACACKTHEADGEHMRHVCKNGPVFNAREVDFNG